MNIKNPYRAPESDLAVNDIDAPKLDSLLKKFFLSWLSTLLVYTLLLVFLGFESNDEKVAILGGLSIASIVAGLVGMLVPSKKRIVYISISCFLSLLIPYLLGQN